MVWNVATVRGLQKTLTLGIWAKVPFFKTVSSVFFLPSLCFCWRHCARIHECAKGIPRGCQFCLPPPPFLWNYQNSKRSVWLTPWWITKFAPSKGSDDSPHLIVTSHHIITARRRCGDEDTGGDKDGGGTRRRQQWRGHKQSTIN
jgi:hypothetical protein